MPSLPCPTSENRCFPCEGDSSNPLANLSLEPPDTNLFPCVVFYSVVNVVPNIWQRTTCVGFDESPTSQTDACDRAMRRAKECIPEPPVPPKDPPPPPPPPPPEPPPPPASNYTFCNDAVTCQSGSDCYTLPECTVFGNSRADANAIAQSICESRVHDPALVSPCAPVQPPEPPEPPLPPSECPSEVGAAISSLEIASQQSWETHSIDNDALIPLVSDSIVCNPTEIHIYIPVSPIDHPPGNYGLIYVDGYFHFPLDFGCFEFNPAIPYNAGVSVYFLQNEEHGFDDPVECNQHHLANSFLPLGTSGFSGCYTDEANAIASLGAHFLGQVFEANPYPPNEVSSFPHSNNGGNFSLLFDDTSFDPSGLISQVPTFPSGPMRFQVVQIEGLIPQPRKVAIADYAALISQFADPVAASGWNGEFNTRDTYTSMVLDWQVAAVGAFGGAKLSYITTHPTSFNGKGWQLDIFSPGMILMWRGFRGVGSTPLGYFFKHSPSTVVGPDCILCTDNSDIPWEPS